MVFIQTCDNKGAEHRQNRSASPKGPVFDSHAVKRLSPAVEKGETHASVTDEVTGFANEVMDHAPVRRADRPEQMNPQWIKPPAGVV